MTEEEAIAMAAAAARTQYQKSGRDIKIAKLRRRFFRDLRSMSFTTDEKIKIGDREVYGSRPMTFAERQKWADILVKWALAPVEIDADP